MDVEKLGPVLKSVCLATTGAFVGAGFQKLSVEFPALDEHSYGCVLKIIRLEKPHIKRFQVSLILMSGLSGVGLYFLDKEKNLPFLVCGTTMLACMPFSKFAIAPTVHALEDPEAKDKMEESEVREKVNTVRKLLTVRTLAAFGAFGYLLYHITS